MKKYLFVCLMFAGCSANNNDKMIKLLSEKKNYEDSVHDYGGYQQYYTDLYKAANDTSKRNLYFDTVSSFNMKSIIAEDRLKKINYSIDSLSKLK